MDNIEFLTKQDTDAVTQMRKIWVECFETDDAYNDLFFSSQYRPEETLVYRENGRILAMGTLMPCTFRTENKEYKAVYIFALGTLPEAQGRQIATKMLKKVDEILPQQGYDASILCPATDELYSFYEKRGYRECFARRFESFPPIGGGKETGAKLRELSKEEYYTEHRKLIPQDSVLWAESDMNFVESESKLYHGGIYALEEGDQRLAVLNIYRYKEKEVIVKEFLTEEGVREDEAAQKLRTLFADSTTHFRFPARKGTGAVEAQPRHAGMIRFYSQQTQPLLCTGQAYLPFILD